MDKKRIAFVILNDPMIFPPTMNAAAILAEKGYQVDIFGLKYSKGGDAIDVPRGVKLFYLGDLKGGFYFRFKLLQVILKLIYLNMIKRYQWIFSYNMTAVLPGYLAALFGKTKWLYHNHDDTLVNEKIGFYAFLKKAEYYCARKSDLVSYPQLDRAKNFFDAARLKEMPTIVLNGPRENWLDVEDWDNFYFLKERYDNVLLYQGGLNWQRGIKNILNSLRFIDKSVGLVLIGKTDIDANFLSELNSFLMTNNLKDQVVVYEVMSYSKLALLTKVCDLGFGVMSTVNENDSYNIRFLAGASNKLVEYMACGLPCIVPENEGYKEYIQRNNLGILVNPNNPRQMANSIMNLLRDEDRYQEMSINAKKYFKQIASFDKQFEKILEKTGL